MDFQTKHPPNRDQKPLSVKDFWNRFNSGPFKIKGRKVWANNRKPPQKAPCLDPLRGPVTFVYLSFDLAPKEKSRLGKMWAQRLGPTPDTKKVIRALQDLQAMEFKKLRREIKYNFMIGGDGEAYEGRGWHFRPEIPARHWFNKHDSLHIGFIGNWRKTPPSKKLIELKEEVIKKGIEENMIKTRHCQIALRFPCLYQDEIHVKLNLDKQKTY